MIFYTILSIVKVNLGVLIKKSNRRVINEYRKIYHNLKFDDQLEEKEEKLLEKLNSVINYCYNNVPYYKDLFDKSNLILKKNKIVLNKFSDLEMIPILTKKLINENLNELKSIRFDDKQLVRNSSGGSTGEKAVFYQDRIHRLTQTSNFLAFLRIHGVRYWQRKHLLVWGNQEDLGNSILPDNIYYHLLFNDSVVLNASNLSEKELNRCSDILKKIKFDYIRGYSQGIFILAKHINDNKIKIKKQKLVISTATQLSNEMKIEIKKAFSCDIVDFYGSREVGSIGYYESNESLKIFHNMNYVEVENIENSSIGELIITNLSNKGMPLIRYKIGDIGIISNNEKQLPFYISKLNGRVADVFHTIDNKKIDGTFLTTILNEFDGINQFQIIQEKIDLIKIRFVSNINVNQLIFDKISFKFSKIFGDECELIFVKEKYIPPSKSGKFLYVICKIDNK
jgi:phenylacetate-CoA ligase